MTATSSRRQNLAGRRFGRLIVLRRAPDIVTACGTTNAAWRCKCDCGKTVCVRAYTLLNGKTTSCRCFQKEVARARFTTHGMTKTRVYRIWRGIKRRINDPSDIVYPYYGGRGIRMCKRWENSFENFLKDMGMPPTSQHSIERRNNEKGYSPGNCQWIPRSEQNRNKRNSRRITFNGATKCVAEWAEDLGLHYMTIMARLNRGLPVEKVLSIKRLSRCSA